MAGGRSGWRAVDDPLLDRIAGGADRIGAPGSFGGLTALWQQRTAPPRSTCGTATAATTAVRGAHPRRSPARPRPSLAPRAGHRAAARQPRRRHGRRRPAGSSLALRASGTGTRVLLERCCATPAPIPPRCTGPVVATHLEAAVAVASGLADAAVGLRARPPTPWSSTSSRSRGSRSSSPCLKLRSGPPPICCRRSSLPR